MTVISRSTTPISPDQQRELERQILRALAAGDAKFCDEASGGIPWLPG